MGMPGSNSSYGLQVNPSCKRVTTSLGVYAELGRCSLLEHRHINILKFYIRLINLDSSRYAYRALLMLIKDAVSVFLIGSVLPVP